MHDSDGPTLARAVYHSIFGGVSGGVASDLFISAEPSHEPDLKDSKVSLVRRPIHSAPSFPFSYSMASVVDEVARHLRIDKRLSAVRWATFVHVGV